MKAIQANTKNSASPNDWILNTKYKITLCFSRVQNLNDIRAVLIFSEHFLILKINEERKKTNAFEVIKNMLHPIHCDEENQIFINYSLIKNFNTQNGLIDIIISNPVNKRNHNLIITSIEKNHLLFSSSLKVEELNRISKSINSKITAEIKHLIEEFLLMITAFKEVLDKEIIKNGVLEDKISRALNEAKKFYDKNLKDLKKQNHLKNDINKKILKEKIQSKQADNISISFLSRVEGDNYATFEMIMSDLKIKGIRLIEQNISLFFEVTSLENNILNLKKVDKSKVSSNLKNINSKNITDRIDEDEIGVNFSTNKNTNKYLNSSNFDNTADANNKILTNYNGDKIIADNRNANNKFISVKKSLMAEKYKTLSTAGNKSFDDSARFAKTRENILHTEFRRIGNNLAMKTENDELKAIPKTPTPQKKNFLSTKNTKEFHSKEKQIKNQNDSINKTNKEINGKLSSSKIKENSTDDKNNINTLNNNNNLKFQKADSTNKIMRMDSDTITDVNGLFDDITNQKNSNSNSQVNNNPHSNYNTKDISATPNFELFLPKNKLEENPAFENYYFENENENVSSSTKTNSKKEDTDNSNTNNGIKYINNLKELKEANSKVQNALETPKFYAKNNSSNLKRNNNARLKEIENLNFAQITKKINKIKDNHLFLVNNSWSNIFSNSSELFCRKYFEFCFEEYFPKFFVVEKDLNGIIKTESFYSYLFYLRGLKNHLFTDENKIQFSNVFFFD